MRRRWLIALAAGATLPNAAAAAAEEEDLAQAAPQPQPPLSPGQVFPRLKGPPRIGEDLALTRWRAESVRGQRVAGDAPLTIEFLADGFVRGDGGCNRFVGPYGTRAGRIVIGPLSTTRRACATDALNRQEALYFETLQRTERGELREKQQVLLLYSSLSDKPSRFLRQP